MNIWLTLIFTALTIALIAAIYAFLKTPKDKRNPKLSVVLEEQLKKLPEKAQATIIKGNKKSALIKFSPFYIYGFMLLCYAIWVDNIENIQCVKLLGINAAYLTLLMFCYILPITFLAISFAMFNTGIQTIKKGYYPPLNAVVFSDTIAKKGLLSKSRGYLLLILPFYCLFVVFLGNNVYNNIAPDKHMQTQKVEAECQ